MKLKLNKMFKGFPRYLKDPKNFQKTEDDLAKIVRVNHKHETMAEYAKCEACEINRIRKGIALKKLGFKNYRHYLEWRQIIGMMLEVKKIQNAKKKRASKK